MQGLISEIRFDANGLIPAIVQDAETNEVLMMAYMNQDSLQLTLQTNETHFWSRSRNELWHKGGTSGNIQKVLEIRIDCDADTLLILVTLQGQPVTQEIQLVFIEISNSSLRGTILLRWVTPFSQ